MKFLDPAVKAAMLALPAEYSIVKFRDHYALEVRGYPRIIIAANHKASSRNVRATIVQLEKLAAKLRADGFNAS